MNKKIAKPMTNLEKVQKLLVFIMIVFFMAVPLILIPDIGKGAVMQRSLITLAVAFVTLVVLILASKMVLPMFISEKSAQDEDAEDEDLFV